MPLPKIETPKYVLQLPSNGQKFTYRPYLVAEQKILMIAMESENQAQIIQAVKDVIRACTNNALNPDTLSVFDLEYVFLKLRAKSTGETSQVSINCEKCSTANKVLINLDEVQVSPKELPSNKLKLTDKIGVVMRWPRISAVADINLEKSTPAEKAKLAFDLIISCIESIYDDTSVYNAEDQSAAELLQFVESLSQQQFSKIEKFIESTPKLEHTVSFSCSKCAERNTLQIRGLQSFFA